MMRRRILDTARQQMREFGTAGLGMRNVARELKIVPSALYRYYSSLDAVITALILEALVSLVDTLEQAVDSLPNDDYAGRMRAVLLAYRGWAMANPIDFQLIYGNPIPGYQAPLDLTLRGARRGMWLIVGILNTANQAGILRVPEEYQRLPEAVVANLKALATQQDYHGDLVVLCLAMVAWARVHGVVMLELFGNIQPLAGDAAAFYRVEIANLMRQIGFI